MAQCDVTNDSAQQAIFEDHCRRHGRLDIAILNAGIFEKGDHSQTHATFTLQARRTGENPSRLDISYRLEVLLMAVRAFCCADATAARDGRMLKSVGAGDFVDSEGASWQATLDVNLRSALVGTRLAAQAMIRLRSKGALRL